MFDKIKTWLQEGVFGISQVQKYSQVDYDWLEWANEAISLNSGQVILDNLTAIRNYSRQLYYHNYQYFGIIRNYVKYISGKSVIVESENESANEKWKEFSRKYLWRRLFKEWVRRFYRDGETFLYLPTMKFIDPYLVSDSGYNAPYGIGKNELGEVEFYSIQSEKTGQFYRVEANLIIHTDCTDDDQARGIPYLFSLMEKSNQMEEWLGDRITLNRIRSSIALVRKHAGATSDGIKSFADSKADDSAKLDKYGQYQRQSYIRPGSIIDAKASTSYEFLSPNIDAKDVSEDGRNIRLCFSAMTGLPEFMISGDASNGNYASTMIAEGPGVREIEDWQDFFKDEIFELWRYITGEQDEPEIKYPQIISRKTKEETDRNKILFDNKVISLEEWRRREDVDSDKMEEEINGSEETRPDGEEVWQSDFTGNPVLSANGKQVLQGTPQTNKDKN